ncbi:TerB family tellurite resistance protein [Pseudahrensia aquimaris]|uniref:TerB family tellurite resistance protein n=1 Tax=Pseudahrensia aquimaris TaxID=744461 RepID=A0ABW3FGX5_9HYPH
MGILESVKDMLGTKSSVQMVADDPQKASELLLVMRMMFADGAMSAEEIAMFKMLCSTVFKIPEADVPEVIAFLKDYGYETSGEQLAAMFEDMDGGRKRDLLVNLISMARADSRMHEAEVDMIARVAKVLGYDPDEVRGWL